MVPNFTYDKYAIQCVGVDISKDKFSACLFIYNTASDLGWWTDSIEFKNNKTGFNQLVRWSRKNSNKDYPVKYLMEPTSTYHEALAYHLYNIGCPVYIIFPAKARDFAKYQGLKTKTDEIDARTLSTIGCTDRKLKPWTPPKPIYRKLKQMCRFHIRMERVRTELTNQLTTLKAGANPEVCVIERYDALLKELDKQQEANKNLIKKMIDEDKELADQISKITTIKGIGYYSTVTILAETDGFSLIQNRKQLASFAGLDVKAYTSGTIDIKHRISKKGSSYLRAALYWPAISASMHNRQMTSTYTSILSRNPKVKMIGVTAIMRKLLLLVFTLWKSGEEYDPSRNGTITPKLSFDGEDDAYARYQREENSVPRSDYSSMEEYDPENPPF